MLWNSCLPLTFTGRDSMSVIVTAFHVCCLLRQPLPMPKNYSDRLKTANDNGEVVFETRSTAQAGLELTM